MNPTKFRNQTLQALRYLACAAILMALSGCEGQIIGPPGSQQPGRASWLSYKYSANCKDCFELRDPLEEILYYCSIDAQGGSTRSYAVIDCNDLQRLALLLEQWKDTNGFSPLDGPFRTAEARAIYGNLYDLRIGRDMNCLTGVNGNVACFVTNYGPPPFDPVIGPNPVWLGANSFPALGQAIDDALDAHAPFATVAMVYNKDAAVNHGGVNAVTFYAFKGDGNLLLSPGLDTEGGKTSPRMCMACHGGSYDSTTHSVTGAQFLPFDMFSFQHSSKPGFRLEDLQEEYEEAYRKLNAIVMDTVPAPAIAEFINGTYRNALTTAGTTADGNFVPPGWSDQVEAAERPLSIKVYNSVYRPYCRMCHLASSSRAFRTFQDFKDAAGLIEDKVCQSKDMPNAQVPFVGFWQDGVARNDLREFLTAQKLTNLHDCQ